MRKIQHLFGVSVTSLVCLTLWAALPTPAASASQGGNTSNSQVSPTTALQAAQAAVDQATAAVQAAKQAADNAAITKATADQAKGAADQKVTTAQTNVATAQAVLAAATKNSDIKKAEKALEKAQADLVDALADQTKAATAVTAASNAVTQAQTQLTSAQQTLTTAQGALNTAQQAAPPTVTGQPASPATPSTPAAGTSSTLVNNLAKSLTFTVSEKISSTSTDAIVDVLLTELSDGVEVTLNVIAKPNLADLRGFFFDLGNDSLLSGLKITGSNISTFAADPTGQLDSIGGKSNNISGDGNTLKFEAAAEIGSEGIGKDDVRSTKFKISSTTGTVKLSDFKNQTIGLRLMSVGAEGARNGSSKLKYTVSSPVGQRKVPEPGILGGLAIAGMAFRLSRRQR